MKGNYGNKLACGARKNKPNSKPNKLVPSTTFRAGSERSRMEPITGLWPEDRSSKPGILNKLSGCGMTDLKAILQRETDSRLHLKPQVIGQILIVFVVKVEVLNIQSNIDIFREPVFHSRSDCVDLRRIG